MGEDLDSMSLKDLQNLEQQLDTALKNIRSRKVPYVYCIYVFQMLIVYYKTLKILSCCHTESTLVRFYLRIAAKGTIPSLNVEYGSIYSLMNIPLLPQESKLSMPTSKVE